MPASLDSRPSAAPSKELPPAQKFRSLAGVALNEPRPNLPAEILSTHTAALFRAAVARGVALDSRAVARIYEIKGRPAHNPIIVHVASREMAQRCAARWPTAAEQLARAFWPGPLTLVLPRSPEIPDLVTAGGPTVGIRWPSHPFIQAVIRECDFPLAAPSANLSNQVSPTNAAHVNKSLGNQLRLIVDGGQSQVGIESTVLDLSANPARVLRPGIIHGESLRAALHDSDWTIADDATPELSTEPLRSPGRLPKHYSPNARLEIWSWQDTNELESKIKNQKSKIERTHVIAHTVIPSGEKLGRVSVIPHDAEAFARAIYAELHECDAAGAELIIVEALPETNEWEAIADRLKRAASV